MVLAAGCVSTQKRYEKGVKLEERGQYEQAAELYLKVLRKDGSHEQARQHLREAGSRIVSARMEQAKALEGVGRYDEAVAALARLDGLRDRAASAGVDLAVPEDYEDYREGLAHGAVTELLVRARRAEEAGDFPTALTLYERLQGAYNLAPEQHRDLDVARARVHAAWADAELGRGRFRSAFGHADQALKIAPPESQEARRAAALQDEALRSGTRYVVPLPVVAVDSVAGEVPRHFLYDLNETLDHEHWNQPPLFLAPVNPDALYREMRRYRSGERLTRDEAASVGRALDADFVILTDLTSFHETERIVKEQRRAVRTKGRNPIDTAYVELQVEVRIRARLSYRLLDPQTRSVVDEGSVEASDSDRFTRGVYSGDFRALDLSTTARRLFDEEVQRRQEEELYTQLMDEFAADLSRRAYDDLLRHVP